MVTTPAEAAKAYDALGGGLIVVKAQVHAGGRGKGVASVRRSTGRRRWRSPAARSRARRHGQGGAAREVGRRGREGGGEPAGQDAGHLPDRRGGSGDLQGAGDGGPQHRPRALPRPGDRPEPQVPGADGLDRGGRRDRDRRRQDPREDPSRADRRRARPGRLPGPQGLQGPGAHRTDGQEGRHVPEELRASSSSTRMPRWPR